MDFTLSKNIPGLLIFIDFHKAFDSLEWNFLLSCLRVFYFGPDFIRWVNIFYKNIQSCVINHGFASDFFALERGVRQGDPLSPPSLCSSSGSSSNCYTAEHEYQRHFY